MKTLVYNNAQHAFEDLYREIHENGEVRNNGTHRLRFVGFVILNPLDSIITTPFRKWNETYANREFEWYLSANRSVTELAKKAPVWDTMHGGDGIVNSNYGYQWERNSQLDKCIEDLRTNNKSRQAWITIMDGKEKHLQEYDVPCTLSIGFQISNDNKVEMDVVMRSNDLWYGFSNDQYCFSKLQKKVADSLGLGVGVYHHYASDMHLYTSKMGMNS